MGKLATKNSAGLMNTTAVTLNEISTTNREFVRSSGYNYKFGVTIKGSLKFVSVILTTIIIFTSCSKEDPAINQLQDDYEQCAVKSENFLKQVKEIKFATIKDILYEEIEIKKEIGTVVEKLTPYIVENKMSSKQQERQTTLAERVNDALNKATELKLNYTPPAPAIDIVGKMYQCIRSGEEENFPAVLKFLSDTEGKYFEDAEGALFSTKFTYTLSNGEIRIDIKDEYFSTLYYNGKVSEEKIVLEFYQKNNNEPIGRTDTFKKVTKSKIAAANKASSLVLFILSILLFVPVLLRRKGGVIRMRGILLIPILILSFMFIPITAEAQKKSTSKSKTTTTPKPAKVYQCPHCSFNTTTKDVAAAHKKSCAARKASVEKNKKKKAFFWLPLFLVPTTLRRKSSVITNTKPVMPYLLRHLPNIISRYRNKCGMTAVLIIILSLCFIPIFSYTAKASEPLEIENFYDANGKKGGRIKSTKEVIIAPEYWDVTFNGNNISAKFSEGLVAVKLAPDVGLHSDKYVIYIDTAGNVMLDFGNQLSDACNFKDGLARVQVKERDRWGFIDRTGKLVVQPKYTEIYDFSDGLAQVWDPSPCFIDRTGKVVIPSKKISPYYYCKGRGNNGAIGSFTNGYCMIKGADIVTETGNTGSRYRDIAGNDHYSFAKERDIEPQPWGFIDKKGDLVVPLQFTGVRPVDENGNFEIAVKDHSADEWKWITVNIKDYLVAPKTPATKTPAKSSAKKGSKK